MPTEPLPPSPPDGVDILAEMDAWRTAHPTATLAEIEAALDERLAALRRRMLADTVAASAKADWSTRPEVDRPTCPSCGVPLRPRGRRTRQLRTAGGDITIERTYGVCPACGAGLFPPR
jgi:YgiT-type zinc finger domain-containing protein